MYGVSFLKDSFDIEIQSHEGATFFYLEPQFPGLLSGANNDGDTSLLRSL